MAEPGRKAVAPRLVSSWLLEDDDNLRLIQEAPISRVYQDHFMPWAEVSDVELISQSTFTNTVKSELAKRDLQNQYVRDGGSSKAGPTKVENTPRSPKIDLHYEEKFEMVNAYVGMVADGLLNTMYVYGTPGVGKSHEVYQALRKRGLRYVDYSGGVRGTGELVKILYQHRDDELLVFDDFDSVFKSADMKNIMKTALENISTRTISWVDDKVRPVKDRVPDRFEFTSGIIFVSNRTRIDPAIKSRVLSVQVNLNRAEILDRIEKKLAATLPSVDLHIKREVFDYILSIEKEIKIIDFRQFQNAVVTRIAEPSKWQRWTEAILKS